MNVNFSSYFETDVWSHLTDKAADAIYDFRDHAERQPNHKALIISWIGKVADTSRTVDEMDKTYCQKYNLWHAHSGEPTWEIAEHGKYKVSKMVIHYQKISDRSIMIIDYTSHKDPTGKFPIPKRKTFKEYLEK